MAESIYNKIGGKPAVDAAVDIFYNRILNDPKLCRFFKHANMDSLRRMQAQFLSAALGGPKYKGRNLRAAHANLKGIKDEHFDAVVGHLAATLAQLEVDEKIVQEIADMVEPLRADVLQTPIEEVSNDFNRFEAAIEGSATAMMMVDRDLVITYTNPATVKLIRDNQAAFNEAYGSLEANALVGTCIDVFHKSPDIQRKLLSDPKNLPYQTDIRIGPLAFALNVSAMVDEHGEYVGNSLEWSQVTEARRDANEAARIRSAIEGSATCMMMIDRDLVITYVNPSTLAMMGENLAVFQDAYPGFSLETLVGSCIDRFHKHPQHQRTLLADPSNLPYIANIQIGPLYFRLNVSAMRDLKGEYIGNTLEWANVTVERVAEQNIATTIEQVDQRTGELNATNSTMVELSTQTAAQVNQITQETSSAATGAEEMSNTMTSISAAAEQASANINSVAVATEQMTNSVAEIANNTERARAVTTDAVRSVEGASSRVEELDSAARSINQVIEAIVEIAEQTKLLALNATIEAARAGEAGKGFAVVANEVKELAKQTREATTDIRTKIENMQASTEGTVTEIGNINRVMNDVNEIVGIIATSVEEQNVATRDIASNIAQASTGVKDVTGSVVQAATVSKEIADNIRNVSTGVQEINSATANLQQSIESVNTTSEGLSSMVSELKRQRENV